MKNIELPGLIDIHVHLRDPGQTHKEDFYTGTSAALAGGFTTVIDMPNNVSPIITEKLLDEKIKIAQEKVVCDIGFHFGSLGNNIDQFDLVKDKVMGIKLYLNQTTGGFIIDSTVLEKVYSAWKGNQPILTHAEEQSVDDVIDAVRKYNKRTHVCHVASENELKKIIKAKDEGLKITCGVCPHHLFLTEDDVQKLGSFALMKPPLKSKKDQEFLWNNLQYIDVFESDHAPHTLEEKNAEKPAFGVPGLETTLPLLLTGVHDGKLTLENIIEKCFTNPKSIFNVPTDENTKVEIDIDEEYIIDRKNLKTKCGWSPFEGMKMKGKIVKTVLRGKTVYENGNIVAERGSGRVIKPST